MQQQDKCEMYAKQQRGEYHQMHRHAQLHPKKTRLQETGRVSSCMLLLAVPIRAPSAKCDAGHGALMSPISEKPPRVCPCDPGEIGTETAEEPLGLGHAEAVGKFECSTMGTEGQELTWQS